MHSNPWIEVWPINQRELKIMGSLDRLFLDEALSAHTEELWTPKASRGWKSSWVPFIKSLKIAGGPSLVEVKAGVMAYKEVEGINDAIQGQLPIIPSGVYYDPCLSVGFLTATSDNKIIFQRRPDNVHCPGMLIHEPCGYMTSLAFTSRAGCDEPRYEGDSRLFHLKTQLDFRRRELAKIFSVDEGAVNYGLGQDLLGAGWKTIEVYFSTIGTIDARAADLRVPEGQEVFFVPFEHLKGLILNQGRLSKVDARDYRPADPREIPLIDESLAGLIWGYERLTGDRLDIPETVCRLGEEGLEIKVHDTSSPQTYEFPGFS